MSIFDVCMIVGYLIFEVEYEVLIDTKPFESKINGLTFIQVQLPKFLVGNAFRSTNVN